MTVPQPKDWIALQVLTRDYWFEVDRHQGAGTAQYWVKDGVFVLEDRELNGLPQIEQFYQWRTDRAPRVSLHVATNLSVRTLTSDRAEISSILTLYAADGRAPINNTLPVGVAMADDICVRTDTDGWRYARRQLRRLFVGTGDVTVPPEIQGAS